MPKNVGRVGMDKVSLEDDGMLTTPLVPNVYVNGKPIAVVGTVVEPHAPYKTPHDIVTMKTGSPNVIAGANFSVCGTGDAATCGHLLISTSNVFVN